MRVVFAHDTRFVECSGGGVLVPPGMGMSLWNRYLRHFREVRLLGRIGAERAEGSWYERVRCSEISFRGVPDVRVRKEFASRLRELWSVAEEEVWGADAVIARLPSETGLAVIGSARQLGRPWAVEVVGSAWTLWSYGGLPARVYAPVMEVRVRRAVRRAPFALYVTRNSLQERYPCPNGRVVSCSNVELPRPEVGVLDRRLERTRGLGAGGSVVFGLIGSLRGRFKGIEIALDALRRVRRSLPGVKLRVLGAGDSGPWERMAAEKGVEDLTLFDGIRDSGRAIFEWLDGIDVYLQPSLSDGLPRSIIEAMSRGSPVIGSDVGGIGEVVSREVLVRPGDARQLAGRMRRMVEDLEFRQGQCIRNWEIAAGYAEDVLEPKRDAFWGEFAAYCRACNGRR